jgi:hypothetical protein
MTEDEYAAFNCWDCNVNTLEIDEYYMVDDGVWEVATEDFGGDGMLCIGCLEARLGGKLVASDFPDLPINRGVFPYSTRLQHRLTNVSVW